MSDKMTPIPFSKLMNWVMQEYDIKGSVFGVKGAFKTTKAKKLDIFGGHIETPVGPAAGPHSQLAQNIVAAYFAGSRFFELKTVQIIDGEDLPVAKPCIYSPEECYNVEWSTELYVNQAMCEYIKAWYAIKLISEEYRLGTPDGFIFNMSVGYDLKGIQSEKVDNYIENMKNAEKTDIWSQCKSWALENIKKFNNVDEKYIENISPKVCNSITLSTLHGCPCDEIEKIANYLITEKKLNTYVKCNPTLLGYKTARKLLDNLGYDYVSFDDHHFKEDLQFKDAISMIKRLQKTAKNNRVAFGVKLTNTFPVEIVNKELPGEEMYMSGPPLTVLALNLAYKLAKEFKGRLNISYSGGADAFNIGLMFSCGIYPITVATTILKPGGYKRFYQLAENTYNRSYDNLEVVRLENLKRLTDKILTDVHHKKAIKPMPKRKLEQKVPLLNCFTAPCSQGCPIHQDIPKYIKLADEGKYDEALDVILEKNPLPFITGTICSHKCMSKCTRNFYEESVQIRNTKLLCAKNGYKSIISSMQPVRKTVMDKKVAIIGGGVAGIAAAYFLKKSGVDVTIFEEKDKLGGIVRYVIPEFRIASEMIDNDISFIEKMGVEVETGKKVKTIKPLKKKGFNTFIFANGAPIHGQLQLEGDATLNVIDFLDKAKNKPEELDVGKNVAIIGGGNTAMDAARVAKRIPGVKNVYIVYRRTKRYMPADEEELMLAQEEGVVFKELLSPVEFKEKKLTCTVMKLGEMDESGRCAPEATEKTANISVDTVISAVGEKVDEEFFKKNSVQTDDRGKASLITNVPDVYVIGDSLRGPSTVVETIADAYNAYKHIMGINGEDEDNKPCGDCAVATEKRGILKHSEEGVSEYSRCLECNTLCECCVDVCPNRANIAVQIDKQSMPQIIHIDAMCNECGNCTMFCPYDSSPYKEKFTYFNTEEDLNNSENNGFTFVGEEKDTVTYRLFGEINTKKLDDKSMPEGIKNLIVSFKNSCSYAVL